MEAVGELNIAVNRRTFLTTGGAMCSGVLSGCSVLADSFRGDRRLHSVAIDGVSSPPSPEFAFDPSIEDRQITTGSTARLRLEYTNESESPVHLGTAPREILVSTASAPRILLVPEGHDLTRRSQDCWQPEENVAFSLVAAGTELDPGATFEQTYELWDNDDERGSNACIQRTTYEFEFPEDARLAVSVTAPD